MYAKVADMNLSGNETYIVRSTKYVNSDTAKSTWLPKGSVVFPKRGAAIHTNKKRILSQNTCVDLNTIGVIPGKDINTLFLYWFFKCLNLSEICEDSGIPQINNKNLIPLDIVVPPMPEQIKFSIVAKQADKSKFAGFKSQFIEMFGDYTINPKGWPVETFDGFARIDATMTTDYNKYAEYPHIGVDSIEKKTGILSGYRTVKEDNVISGKYLFSPKHIIYSKIRPNLNKVALPDFYGVCSADAYPILPTEGKCDRIYLAYLMRSDFFLSYILKFSARSNMPKVNREQIRGFRAPLPPFESQKKFSVIVKRADKSKYLN